MRLSATRSSRGNAPGPETSIFPNEVMSMIPTRSRKASCSTRSRSNQGGFVKPNARWSAPALRLGFPGSKKSARSHPFFVPKTAPRSWSRPWSGESRFGLPHSSTSNG